MAEPLSILDKIIENEKNKQLQELDVETEVNYLLSNPKIKKEREKEVIRFRYGLNGEKAKTLEEIGRNLGITRERVRQIEKNTLKKITDFADAEKRVIKSFALLSDQIEALGGIATFADLAHIILREDEKSPKARHNLNFLILLNKKFVQISDSNEYKKGLYLKSADENELFKAIKVATEILETEKKPVEEKALIKKIKEKASLEEITIASALAVSKKILKTEEGHFGLSQWREINPRSIRDKTYYILKKHKKPLHFTDISIHIENMDKAKKKVTKQAVHNELIRDERFVLIGRGIYALSEWGYKKGVIEDVIIEILIEAGEPLHKDVIIEEVLKRRVVKETTILLNLQKNKFRRVARATYGLSNRGE